MFRRFVLLVLGLLLVAVTAPGSAAAVDPPRPSAVPGGLTPQGRTLAATKFQTGDCELEAVNCKPNRVGSCSGYTSQDTPPSTILVLVRDTESTFHIVKISFLTYVQNVLPNEWPASYDGDALKAGAVAIKSYAWYWVTHFGGYIGSTPANCFDVTDDQDFQVYKPNSAVARTNQKIADSWPVAARRDGQIVQTSYQSYLVSPSEACGAGRNGTTMSQIGTQACNEQNTGFKYNVILKLYYGSDLQLSTTAQLRSQHDFTFTARSTGAVFNAGAWTIGDGYSTRFSFGSTGDVPLVTTGGDGFAGIAVWRPSKSVFYLGGPTGGAPVKTLYFGAAGDRPVPAQYQGLTAPTQLAVFRPGNGVWYLAAGNGAAASSFRFGARGDIPVPARWQSATADSAAVFRPATGVWYVRGRSTGLKFGANGDIPLPADYNGDGRTDLAVYRPANHTFYVRNGPTVTYGAAKDVPVTGDFTGDGKANLVVYRPANHTWYVRGGTSFNLGAGTPIGEAPYSD